MRVTVALFRQFLGKTGPAIRLPEQPKVLAVYLGGEPSPFGMNCASPFAIPQPDPLVFDWGRAINVFENGSDTRH